MLSIQAIHRGTFPCERDVTGRPVADYSAIRNRAPESLSFNAGARLLLEDTYNRLDNSSGLIDDGNAPEWATFINILIPNDNHKFDQIIEDTIDAVVKNESTRNFPYKLNFLHLAKIFLTEFSSRFEKFISGECRIEVFSNLAHWYLSKLSETARYVLHIDYEKSELGHSEWLEGFSKNGADNKWVGILNEFPLLLRSIHIIHIQSYEFFSEFLSRFLKDRVDILRTLGDDYSGTFTSIKVGLSDPHRNGKTVMELHLSGGGRLVYKPKSLELDEYIYEHLLGKPEFGILPVATLSRKDYGWAEYISSKKIHDMSSCAIQIGRASATFWMLNSTDLHAENIVVGRGGVYPIDLETLLLPRVNRVTYNEDAWRNNSILSTLLFDFSFGGPGKINISGFVPSDNIKEYKPIFRFELNSNAINILKQEPDEKSLTERTDNFRNLSRNIDVITDSFRNTISDKNVGFLKKFVDQIPASYKQRFIFRDTQFYSQVLEKLRQPRFLRDGGLTFLELLHLYSGIEGDSQHDYMHLIIDDEIKQLLRGDIPYFSTSTDGKDLFLSDGKVDNFFEKSGKFQTADKIAKVESSDIEEQVTLIELSLDGYRADRVFQPDSIGYPHHSESSEGDSRDHNLLSLASRIVSSAFQPNKSPSRWISMYGDIDGRVARVHIGDVGFFNGSLGIILALEAFLSSTPKVTEDISLIHEFLDREANLMRVIEFSNTRSNSTYLGFMGVGGEIFAKTILVYLNQGRWSFLESGIQSSLATAGNQVEIDRWLDVVGGVAGLALGCDLILRFSMNEEVRSLAARVFKKSIAHLIERATAFGESLAWTIPGETFPNLGYAHGWAGIISALVARLNVTDDRDEARRIEACIEAASAFPHELFLKDGHWWDYRFGPSKQTLNESWCNGIPGFLRGVSACDPWCSETVKMESDTLRQRTLDRLGERDLHRFCCGEMGHVDFYMDHASSFDKGQQNVILGRMKSAIRRSVAATEAVNMPDTLIPELSFPGLFHGRAGILYTATRERVPNLPSLSGQRGAV